MPRRRDTRQVNEYRFPSGLKIVTFELPPEGFNPLQADDDDLIRFGYPRRPDDEEALARWISVLSEPFQLVKPSFSLNEDIEHRPQQDGSKVFEGAQSSSNWSGGVIYAPTGTSLQWVHGEWTVPEVGPIADDGIWSYCSSWIGIDGSRSTDVLQAGVMSKVIATPIATVGEYYPWMEWYPEKEIKIDGMFVGPGDAVGALICAISSQKGACFYYNRNNHTAVSFNVWPPSTTSLSENCAEWIVERPLVNGVVSRLAKYHGCTFEHATAGTVLWAGGQTLQADAGDTMEMKDGATTISSGAVTSSVVKCTFV